MSRGPASGGKHKSSMGALPGAQVGLGVPTYIRILAVNAAETWPQRTSKPLA
jgi:hypothetical protein